MTSRRTYKRSSRRRHRSSFRANIGRHLFQNKSDSVGKDIVKYVSIDRPGSNGTFNYRSIYLQGHVKIPQGSVLRMIVFGLESSISLPSDAFSVKGLLLDPKFTKYVKTIGRLTITANDYQTSSLKPIKMFKRLLKHKLNGNCNIGIAYSATAGCSVDYDYQITYDL